MENMFIPWGLFTSEGLKILMSQIAASNENSKLNCGCWCHNPFELRHNFDSNCHCLCSQKSKGFIPFSNNPIEELYKMKQESEQDVSPMVKQMQILEKRIDDLEKRQDLTNKNMVNEMFDSEQLRNSIADLSVKVNQQNSSLREFEKQRVDPKFEEVARDMSDHDERICDIENTQCEKRLVALESDYEKVRQTNIDSYLKLQSQINKLKEHKNYQIAENRKEDRRIEAIEKDLNHVPSFEAIKELEEKINVLFLEKTNMRNLLNEVSEICGERLNELDSHVTRNAEEIRDIRELRYANHQIIGIVDTRTQAHDLAIEDLAKKVDGLQESFNNMPHIEIRDSLPVYKQIMSLVRKVEKLEALIDTKKLQEIILDGAMLHAEILRLSKKLEDAKGLENKPHKCPACYGRAFCESLDLKNRWACHACEGKGLVWNN